MIYAKLSDADFKLIENIKNYFNGEYNQVACVMFARKDNGEVYTCATGDGIFQTEIPELIERYVSDLKKSIEEVEKSEET